VVYTGLDTTGEDVTTGATGAAEEDVQTGAVVGTDDQELEWVMVQGQSVMVKVVGLVTV